MKSLFARTCAALIVMVAVAGCANPGPQEKWFDYLDRVNSYNGAD